MNSLAVVADPDTRERLRCMRILARQTPVCALGAANWGELQQTVEEDSGIGLIFYTRSLPGAPADAIQQLLPHTGHLILAVEDGEQVPTAAGVTRVRRPLEEETLVLMARATGARSTSLRMSFMPVDFIQMICMSGDSQVLVLSHDGADVGII
ncbi:MAG TPA: hypothetical protein VFQ61_35700, partial [Polyangiaceae bacterium]|nr:hypothetical protein [Polyangiaceae bacterium]